jgi:hypothetical protein
MVELAAIILSAFSIPSILLTVLSKSASVDTVGIPARRRRISSRCPWTTRAISALRWFSERDMLKKDQAGRSSAPLIGA